MKFLESKTANQSTRYRTWHWIKNMSSSCCLHLAPTEDDPIIQFSEVSFNKIKDCMNSWLSLDGKEKDISKELTSIISDSTTFHSLPDHVGYHRKCYMRFTDRNRIEKAKKRVIKQAARDRTTAETDSTIDLEPPAKRYLRSDLHTHSPLNVNKPSSAGQINARIFPKHCVICRKTRYITERLSRKRKTETLSLCQTKQAENSLQEAAVLKCDHMLLLQIQGEDLIAKEAHYHKSCYREYTHCLRKDGVSSTEIETIYSVSFDTFCKTVVEENILKKHEILRMNELTKRFIKTVEQVENIHCSYRNSVLKSRLKRKYPQLIFVKPHRRSECELVLCDFTDSPILVQEKNEFE